MSALARAAPTGAFLSAPVADSGGGAIAAGAADAVRGSEVSREVQLSCGSHTDYGLLTLVNQEAGISALQVRLFV